MTKCSRVKCKYFAGWKDKKAKPCSECVEKDKKLDPSAPLKALRNIISK